VLGDLGYDYDAGGRRTAISGSYARTGLPAAVASATYDDANELTDWRSASLGYDENGNLTSDGGTTYSWNARNELGSLSGDGGLAASFQYDPFGRRVRKTVNGQTTRFLYDHGNVIQELLESGSVTANLPTGPWVDEIFTRTESGASRDFFSDALGSTLALTDGSGTVQTQYSYEPFGKTTPSGPPDSNGFQYTGREPDGQTNLYYYRARYYSPNMQRFASEDPLGISAGDPNYYIYAGNHPMDARDPSGMCCEGLVALDDAVGGAFHKTADFVGDHKGEIAVGGVVAIGGGVCVIASAGTCAVVVAGGAIGGVTGATGAAAQGGDPWVGGAIGGGAGMIPGMLPFRTVAGGAATGAFVGGGANAAGQALGNRKSDFDECDLALATTIGAAGGAKGSYVAGQIRRSGLYRAGTARVAGGLSSTLPRTLLSPFSWAMDC
jgi:RHS repeat-associated protein